MLESMSDLSRTKFETKESAVDILDSLQEMFRQKNKQVCIEITGKYTIAKMKSKTPIRDHIMTMTNYFTETELYGTEIDQVTQVRIILNSVFVDVI